MQARVIGIGNAAAPALQAQNNPISPSLFSSTLWEDAAQRHLVGREELLNRILLVISFFDRWAKELEPNIIDRIVEESTMLGIHPETDPFVVQVLTFVDLISDICFECRNQILDHGCHNEIDGKSRWIYLYLQNSQDEQLRQVLDQLNKGPLDISGKFLFAYGYEHLYHRKQNLMVALGRDPKDAAYECLKPAYFSTELSYFAETMTRASENDRTIIQACHWQLLKTYEEYTFFDVDEAKRDDWNLILKRRGFRDIEIRTPEQHVMELAFTSIGCSILEEEVSPLVDRYSWLQLVREGLASNVKGNPECIALLECMTVIPDRLDLAYAEERFQSLDSDFRKMQKSLMVYVIKKQNSMETFEKLVEFSEKLYDFCYEHRYQERFRQQLNKMELPLRLLCDVLILGGKNHSKYSNVITNCNLFHKLLREKPIPSPILPELYETVRNLVDIFTDKLQKTQFALSKEYKDNNLSMKYYELRRDAVNHKLKLTIARIGDLEWVLKQKGEVEGRELKEHDLRMLNCYFYKSLIDYELCNNECHAESVPLSNQIWSSCWKVVKRCAFLDFCEDTLWTKREFLMEKHYADMGYSMSRYIKTFIDDPAIKSLKPLEYIQTEFYELEEWAIDHPRIAASLVGNLVQTFTILFDEDNLLEQFKARMVAISYTLALLAPLGTSGDLPYYDPKLLRFKALADFSSLLVSNAAAAGVIRIIFSNVSTVQKVSKLMTTIVGTRLVKEISDAIPSSYVGDVVLLSAFVAGESFEQICSRYRSIELMRVLGVSRRIFQNPKELFAAVTQHLFTCWKAVKLSVGSERIARIVAHVLAPLGCILGMISLIAAATASGVLATATIALWGSLFVFGSVWVLFWKLNFLLKFIFGDEVWKRAQKTILEEWHPGKINEAIEQILLDYQAAGRTNDVAFKCPLDLDRDEDLYLSSIAESYRNSPLSDEKILENVTIHFCDTFIRTIPVARDAVIQSPVTFIRPQHVASEVMRRIHKTRLEKDTCPRLRELILETAVSEQKPPEGGISDQIATKLNNSPQFSNVFKRNKQGKNDFVRFYNSRLTQATKSGVGVNLA